MNKFKKTFALFITLMFITTGKTNACSSFFFNSTNKILAKNFDWYSGSGVIIKNLKNQKKIAYGFRGENVAEWISKYGSITFNQIGKEFPYGGINEAGVPAP